MLVINRKKNETLVLGGGITVTVIEIRGDKVRLGIVCPPEMSVHRQEVYDAIQGRQPLLHRSPVERAFLQAILEEPDDENVRLIFADWLEEQGNPYGEFIRTQCLLATLPPEDGRRQDLWERERLLWRQHGETWRAYLPAVLQKASFERGFVETVYLQVDEFLRHAEAIFAAAPVRCLRVQYPWGPREGLVGRLAKSPYLARLGGLDLSGQGVGDDETSLLATSPHVGSLTTLVLRGNQIGNAGAIALAHSPGLTGLTMLDLATNDVGEAGAQALAASPSLAGLHVLDLLHNSMGKGGKQVLRSRFGDRVRL